MNDDRQVATAQLAVPAAPSVCFDASVGDGTLPSAGVAASFRLFVSPVKPSLTQVGADELVPVSVVTASTCVAPAEDGLAAAAVPVDAPLRVFQWVARPTLVSFPVASVA